MSETTIFVLYLLVGVIISVLQMIFLVKKQQYISAIDVLGIPAVVIGWPLMVWVWTIWFGDNVILWRKE